MREAASSFGPWAILLLAPSIALALSGTIIPEGDVHEAAFGVRRASTSPGHLAQTKPLEALYFQHFTDKGRRAVTGPSKSQFDNAPAKKSPQTGSTTLASYDRTAQCSFIKSLKFDLYFHYLRDHGQLPLPVALEQRVRGQVELLKGVYEPLGIKFAHKKTSMWDATQLWPPTHRGESALNDVSMIAWRNSTRFGGATALNVWITDRVSVRLGLLLIEIKGISSFPEDLEGESVMTVDGIIIREALIGSSGEDSTTLVHEVGHWLGLKHTFGDTVDREADDCKKGDGILDTEMTRGLRSVVHECSQVPCFSRDEKKMYNYMSYSVCRGENASESFTTGQRAAMFARSLYWRRGYRGASECRVPDPGIDPSFGR